MTRVHELKTWPDPFSAILAGTKRHEIRVDDRGFAVGDTLLLREWNDGDCALNMFAASGYTGRSISVVVTYLTPGGAWGLPENLCVMSIERERRCSCTHEAGDSICEVHTRCEYCGAETETNVKECAACHKDPQ